MVKSAAFKKSKPKSKASRIGAMQTVPSNTFEPILNSTATPPVADIFKGFLFKLSFDLNDLKGQFTSKEITHHVVPTAKT